MITLAVLPGDGIGEEVTLAAIPVFSALNIPVKLSFGDVGWPFWQAEGNSIPDRTWQLVHQVDATLLGAATSKPHREAKAELARELQKEPLHYVSPIIQLRQALDLFANVRPCFNIKGEGDNFNFCIIRENTEGLYAGFDYHPLPPSLQNLLAEKPAWKNKAPYDLSCSLRLQTKSGLKRLFEFAFEYADKKNMLQVTLADKPNVLRQSGAFAREIFESIAMRYPHVQAEILNVDAVALWMIRRPQQFGVIVAENMFGDILSDVGAGLMGGLGFAPSANMGEKGCYFEPVHGSAPRMPKNRANPSAMFLTIALLLEHFAYLEEAERIKKAVAQVVKLRQKVTYDLGGNATTQEMARAVINSV